MGALEGQVAVVTGGARGIGRAIVERFAAEGAMVAALDVDTAPGGALQGERVRFFACDVAHEQQVRNAIELTVRQFGPVTQLVNNAGVNAYFDAGTMSEHDWDSVFAVDLKGAWLCCKHALPGMLSAGRGSVVTVASIHASMTIKGMFPYAAAKSGLVGLTRSLALDYGRDNIRVNAICPGFIHTRLVDEWLDSQPDREAARAAVLDVHPLGRIGTPEDVANLALFLASDQAAFITGAAILVDGGLSARFAT